MAEAEVFVYRGRLSEHSHRISAITTNSDPTIMLSSSHDKSIVVWRITNDSKSYAVPQCRLTGHTQIVSDVVLSSHSKHAISAAWDGDLRFWNLASGLNTHRFVGHTNHALSVTLFNDSVIASGARDNTVKVWNALGKCMATLEGGGKDGHFDWVTCVRFVPAAPATSPKVVTAAWDGSVKVWDVDMSNRGALVKSFATSGHDACVNSVALPPDGSVMASGGTDGLVKIWDMEGGGKLHEIDVDSFVHGLSFCPTKFWLSIASEKCVIVWDLESKKILEKFSFKKTYCSSLNWSGDGRTLFCGCTDGGIRVWELVDFDFSRQI